jgi:hypothetical protein
MPDLLGYAWPSRPVRLLVRHPQTSLRFAGSSMYSVHAMISTLDSRIARVAAQHVLQQQQPQQRAWSGLRGARCSSCCGSRTGALGSPQILAAAAWSLGGPCLGACPRAPCWAAVQASPAAVQAYKQVSPAHACRANERVHGWVPGTLFSSDTAARCWALKFKHTCLRPRAPTQLPALCLQ